MTKSKYKIETRSQNKKKNNKKIILDTTHSHKNDKKTNNMEGNKVFLIYSSSLRLLQNKNTQKHKYKNMLN